MGTNRPMGPTPRYQYPGNNPPGGYNRGGPPAAPGFHGINQYAPRSSQMGGQHRVTDNGGQQYFPTPNYQYYPPPPPPPRPPPPIRMIPPGGGQEPPKPPGTSSHIPANGSRFRGPAPPPPPPPPIATGGSRPIRPGMNGTYGPYTPLAPPPLPPPFPYMSPHLAQSLKEGASLYGQSYEKEASNLPFVPIVIDDKDLMKMTQSLKTQAENRGKGLLPENASKGKNLLLYEDILDDNLPKELKEMRQALYCKLCTLTLSSPVVARDHYKGKRHKKAEEAWMQNNPSKRVPIPEKTAAKPPQGSLVINGTVTPAGPQKNTNQGNDRMAFPVPGPPTQGQKRALSQSPVNKPPGSNHEFIPAYRAALAGPGPAKKPKKEDGSGPNFGFCEICQVNLTSQANSDQHYNGKKHKERLQNGRKVGEFGEDPRFGIGAAFNNVPPRAPYPGMNQQRYN